MSQVRHEYEVEDFFDLVAAIGGASGVFLGISLLQVLLRATRHLCPIPGALGKEGKEGQEQAPRRRSTTPTINISDLSRRSRAEGGRSLTPVMTS